MTRDWRLDFANLTDVQWRRAHESAHGIFIAEGNKNVVRALSLGYVPIQVLTQPKWLQEFSQFTDLPIAVLTESEVAAIAGFKVHRGTLAAFARPNSKSLSELLTDHPNPTVAVLESVVDHENVGASFRNCAALGVDFVVLTQGCADPLYRRSLKVSMGSALAVPYCEVDDSQTVLDAFHGRNIESHAFVTDGDLEISDWKPVGPTAIWVGSEGAGLKASTVDRCESRIRIEMDRDTDSLNVATSLALALWLRREVR